MSAHTRRVSPTTSATDAPGEDAYDATSSVSFAAHIDISKAVPPHGYGMCRTVTNCIHYTNEVCAYTEDNLFDTPEHGHAPA